MAGFPVGVRFLPTDEELISHHLRRKIRGERCVIPEVDFYEYDPWELPRWFEEHSSLPSDGWEWFFVCPTRNKYRSSSRSNRGTKSGFWKVTGGSHDVRTRETDELIGIKKILVFKLHDSNNSRSEWVMHEYHLISNASTQMPYVLCRLKKRAQENGDGTSCYVGGSSSYGGQGLVTTENQQATLLSDGVITPLDTIEEQGDHLSHYNSSPVCQQYVYPEENQGYYYGEQWSGNYY